MENNNLNDLKRCPQHAIFYTPEKLREIANYLLRHTKYRPKIAIICGSGLGSLADAVQEKDEFPYKEIPYFPVSTVPGHRGVMVFGLLNGIPVMCMQGRFHFYEGYSLETCVMPVKVMSLIGCTHLLATCAGGGLSSYLNVGDIMILNDHVNLMGMAGIGPLMGPLKSTNPFVDMFDAYEPNIVNRAKKIAKELGIEKQVKEGVYTCVGGPNYETRAEIRALKILKVDAVGMSTTHEVITAKFCGMKAFAFCLITNICDENAPPVKPAQSTENGNNNGGGASHEEVITIGNSCNQICGSLMQNVVKAIHDENL